MHCADNFLKTLGKIRRNISEDNR